MGNDKKAIGTLASFYAWRRHLGVILLLGLLFLRLPFAAGIRFLGERDWVYPVFEIGTYALTAALIWWERERLADFHIGQLSVWIIIIFKPLETIILRFEGRAFPLAFPSVPSLIIWMIAITLAAFLWKTRPNLKKANFATYLWFAVGLEVGILMAILFAIPESFQIDPSPLGKTWVSFLLVVPIARDLVYQMGYAAVSEEPLFRGFLWGYLRKMGWKDVWIWLFQALLFTLAHVYYINRFPLSFWFIVPIGALVLGLLAWRSRTIATSMAAHSAVNAFTRMIANMIAVYLR
ncbi:MAG: CPBP family intramembrane metalloprotease [Chloroflexi bacterium]|nr:CPBP family intramembrane metalloprotease [Chloroflexota bacterium]